MHRRPFLKLVGSAGLIAPFLSTNQLLHSQTKADQDDFYLSLVRTLDSRIAPLRIRQEKNKTHRWVGGVMDPFGIHAAIETAKFIRVLASVYCEPASQYFHNPELVDSLMAAACYMRQVQHPDGTINLHTTNFNSTPDTGFVIEYLTLAYSLLNSRQEEKLAPLISQLHDFIIHAGKALCIGGIHTPNHRWVISMALARINALFPNPEYVQRIDQWLAEKIDIDPDGQFTEKSTSIYSPLTDRCLITMARLLNRPELYEPVRRNLDMTLYYIHPDGEIVTDASRRQDQYQRGSMAPYYYPYRFMALLDQNSLYAAMTRLIEKTAKDKLADELIFMQEDPSLKAGLLQDRPLPDSFVRIFPYSQLVRIRRGDVSATVLAKNPNIFSFHKGSAALEAVRLATAFFGRGQFAGELLQQTGEQFVLTKNLEGPYYQPLPLDKLQPDGDWEKSDRSLRPTSQVQHLQTRVVISETDGRFELFFDIQGTDDVPVAIELAFRTGGQLQGVQSVPDIENAFLLGKGMGKYIFEGSEIIFGAGIAEHSWTQLRGSLPKLNAMCVYLTGYTPFKFSLKIG
jgi:hypothetical protein